MRRLIAAAALVAVSLGLPAAAGAETSKKGCGKTGNCFIVGKKSPDPTPAPTDAPATGEARRQGESAYDKQVRATERKFDREYATYKKAQGLFDACLRKFNPTPTTAPFCGSAPIPPDPYLIETITGLPGGGAPARITGGQAAVIAVARLQLPTVAPGIGPSPDINPWKMAAVGYPLWLWADGPTHVGPVSDSVGGLTVSLEARVSSVTFRMGDGESITCAGAGRTWTRAVTPGAKSPTCGYAYAKPSLPEGKYTVAAVTNWAVSWTSNAESGVIDVLAVQTAQLPVGELQVLVR